MTSQAKIDANRKNGRKSKGPITAEGRMRSSLNALKTGNFSKKSEQLRENSLNFETRQHKWMSVGDPRNDPEEFLINRRLFLSFEVERAERAHLQHIRTRIDNAEENEHSEVTAIGARLFHDPAGHHALYGIQPSNRSKVPKTSGNGEVPDENDPSKLVKILEGTQIGCLWLRSNWEVLKARLEDPPRNWQSVHRFQAIRLLGRQPVEAMVDYRVAEIFVASHVIKPMGNSAYDDLLSDMTTGQHETYLKKIGPHWPELKSIREPAEARELLIDLCEWKIEELNEKLEEFKENADAIAEKKWNDLGTDESPKGRSMRAYVHKCESALSRVEELFRKRQGKRKSDEERGNREPRRLEDASSWPMDPAPRQTRVAKPDMPVADEELDLSWAYEGGQAAEFPIPLPQRVGRGEGFAQPALLPRDGEEKALQQQADSPAGDEAYHSQEIGAVDVIEATNVQMTQQSEKTENVRNEPKSDEDMIIAKSQMAVKVTANSEADSGLDSLGSFSNLESQTPEASTCPRESDRQRRRREKRERKEIKQGIETKITAGPPSGDAHSDGSAVPTSDAQDDGLSEPSLLPGGDNAETIEPECHSPAADQAGDAQENGAADAIEEPRDEIAQRSGKTENVGNEPRSDEELVIGKTQMAVEVTANSEADPGLDSFGSFSKPESQTPAVVRRPRESDRERNRREKKEFAEIRRGFETKIKAGHPLDREMLFDIVRATAKVRGFTPPPFPHSP